MKLLLLKLSLALLCMQLVLSISLDERRKRAATSQKNGKTAKNNKASKNGKTNKNSLKNQNKRTKKGLVVLTSRTDFKFFSMVPMRMIRRTHVRFVLIALARIHFVNCLNSFDPRYCQRDCLVVGHSIDTRCPDCDGKDKGTEICTKQELQKTCVAIGYKFEGEFQFKQECCEYTFGYPGQDHCLPFKNNLQVRNCCKIDTYKDQLKCQCQQILDHPDRWDDDQVTKCCAEQREKGIVDYRCKSNECTIHPERCCLTIYIDNPAVYPESYKNCCNVVRKEFPNLDWKKCDCPYILDIRTPPYKERVDHCCEEPSNAKNCACIDCDTNFDTKCDNCCKPYMDNLNLDATKRNLCCQEERYKNNFSACNCGCKRNAECCTEEPHASTKFCKCNKIILTQEYSEDPEYKDCYCEVKGPEDPRCKNCAVDWTNPYCCKKIFISDILDLNKYTICCTDPAVKNEPECQCPVILKTPSRYPLIRVQECCSGENPPEVCCDYVRKYLFDYSFPKTTMELCCKPAIQSLIPEQDIGRKNCCSKFFCPKDCPEKRVYEEKCCDYYFSHAPQFQGQIEKCCGSTPCNDCTTYLEKLPETDYRSKMCCEKQEYKQVHSRCITCTGNTPDVPKCCNEIVHKNLNTYKNFQHCCEQPSLQSQPHCKPPTPDYCKTHINIFQVGCCVPYYFKTVNDVGFDKSSDPNSVKIIEHYHSCCGFYPKNDLCNCKNIVLKEPSKYQKEAKEICCNQLTDKELEEFKEVCVVGDCTTNPPTDKCKCDTFFRTKIPPYDNDINTYNDCCNKFGGYPQCTCQNILKYKLVVDNRRTQDCCNNNLYWTNSKFPGVLECSKCHFHVSCCKDYFNGEFTYAKSGLSGEEESNETWKKYRESCCWDAQTKGQFYKNYNEKCIGITDDCTKYPDSLYCCNQLTPQKPGDAETQRKCCLNSSFKDKHNLCSCTQRWTADNCCAEYPKPEMCCNKKEDYKLSTKYNCCRVKFNTNYCCDDFSQLNTDQKQQCCEQKFIPNLCCKAGFAYNYEKCCDENSQFTEKCCNKQYEKFLPDISYKTKCCSLNRYKIDIIRSQKICSPHDEKTCDDCKTDEDFEKKPHCKLLNCPRNIDVCDKCKTPEQLKKDECKHCRTNPIKGCHDCKTEDDFIQKAWCKNCPPPDFPTPKWPDPKCVPSADNNYCVRLNCYMLHRNSPILLQKCLCKNIEYKRFNPIVCLCYVEPEHPDCACGGYFPSQDDNPSCCLLKQNKEQCDCQKIFKMAGFPLRRSQVPGMQRTDWEKCCTMFYPKGFCFQEVNPPDPPFPPQPPIITPDCLTYMKERVLDPTNIDDRMCCSMTFIKAVTQELSEAEVYKRCCQTFGGFKFFLHYCTPPSPPSCTQAIIDNPKDPKKPECCKVMPFVYQQACNVCAQDCVYQKTGDYHSQYVNCCMKNISDKRCCTTAVMNDPNSPIFSSCCDHYPLKCCQGDAWKDPKNHMHSTCCARNLDQCCPESVLLDDSHPDHKRCCATFDCKPHPNPKCKTLEQYRKDPRVCCAIKEMEYPYCPCVVTNCKTILKQNTDKEKVKNCCSQITTYPLPEVCLPPVPYKDCIDVWMKYIMNDKWEECCRIYLYEPCARPNPKCYPTDMCEKETTHPYYAECCQMPKPCTIEVFNNPRNPYFDYCCRLHPQMTQCNYIPPPCIQDPCVEKDANTIQEEYFNMSGVLSLKSRMMKKRKLSSKSNHAHNVHIRQL